MRKPRILLASAALAAASLLPMTAAGEDPITLYGRVYLTVESVEARGGNAPIASRTRLADQFSNVGVRGTETLAPGVKAFFQLETAFKPDQNDTTFGTRNSGVGLDGPWGRVMLGRWDTPFEDVTSAVDAFGDLTNGGIAAALNGSGVLNQNGTFDRRDQNVVQYSSPTISGITLTASYSANEGRTAAPCAGATSGSCNPWRGGASLSWTTRNLFLAYAYDTQRDIAFGPVTPHRQSGNAIMARAVAGPFTLGGIYEEFRRDGFSTQKAWLANVRYTIGTHHFIYQYQDARDGGASGAQPRCHVNVLAYQYWFSKRTFLILQYVDVANNATATCNFGNNPLAIAPGQDPRGTALGLRHVF
jgi:predicted porin